MTPRIESKSLADVSGFSKKCDRSLAFSPSEWTVLTDWIKLSCTVWVTPEMSCQLF